MSEKKKNEKMKGILTDVTKCIGCERCVEACVRVNKLPPELPFRTEKGDGLSGRRFTAILKVPGTDRTVRKQCLHCLEPSCAAACLVGAFTKREDGPVVYDASKCIGCRYCMLACPFMIPRYEWEKRAPYIRKCKMNEECRVEGGMPACVSACPTGATIFGPREKLIEEARRRIKERPDLYIDHIWGERELGGTCVMYISSKDAPLWDLLRFPRDEELEKRGLYALKRHASIPEQNHGWVMLTPFWAGTVFSGLWGIWLIRRRQLLMSGKEPGRGPSGPAGIDEVCPLPEEKGPPGSEDDSEDKEGK